MSKDNAIIIKAITLGDYSVGKTSLCNLLNNKKFVKNTKQTLGINFETVEYNLYNNKYKLYIWDTSGHERFEKILNLYIKNTKLFFLVFNHSKIGTFNILKNKLKLINEYEAEPNIILIGNIFDEKKIESEIINKFIDDNNLKYVEIDCKKKLNNDIFEKICSFNKISNIKKKKKEKDRSFCNFLC